MMTSRLLAFQLSGGPPYGIRLQGGDGTAFVVSKIRPASKAEAVGLQEADVLVAVNGIRCRGLSHSTTTALMDLNDHLLTVHVLRGVGAMSDLGAAEQSMGSQLTVLSESDASALVGNKIPFNPADSAVTGQFIFSANDNNPQLQVVPSANSYTDYGVTPPGATYSRSEQTINDGGTARRTIEEKETKKIGGTTMTTVTRKEYSTYSSSGGADYQPRRDPFVRSLENEGFHTQAGDPDWYGERREDRSQFSVSTSQPRQPASTLEYVGSYTVGSRQPYASNDVDVRVEQPGFGMVRQTGGFDRQQQQQQQQQVLNQSWQVPVNQGTFYEGDIKPGQSVSMPGFTISIEAPRQQGRAPAGPQPIVTVTPADSETHVVTVAPPNWQQQQQQQSWESEYQQPQVATIRVAGPSQIQRQPADQDDRQPQYGYEINQSRQAAPVASGQWQQQYQPAVVESTWISKAEDEMETQRRRLEEMGSEWRNQDVSAQQQQQQQQRQQEWYGVPGQVDNVSVTVGTQPNFIVKQEPSRTAAAMDEPAEGPFYATRPYSMNQPPPVTTQWPTAVPQARPVQNHVQSEPQYYEHGQTFPYSARGTIAREEPQSPPQQHAAPWSNEYEAQPPPVVRYQQPVVSPQSPPARPNLYIPSSNLASSSSPDMTRDANSYSAHPPSFNRSSSYTAGFPQQGQSYPPAPGQQHQVGYPTRSPQQQFQTGPSYPAEPQTAPVIKPSFKLPRNPHFNVALLGNESSGGQQENQGMTSGSQGYSSQEIPGYQAQELPQTGPMFPGEQYNDGYNQHSNIMQSPTEHQQYGEGPVGRNVWSPPAMQRNPWQQGGFSGGPGAGYMEQNDGGYYNAGPVTAPPPPPPINQMPQGGMIPPMPAAAAPPPPVAPPLPENPFKVYGISTNSSDRNNLENKVKLANSVAHAVLSPENSNSRGQKMFLRRQQNSHKWTTSGPDPVMSEPDQHDQRQPWAAAGSRGQGQVQQQGHMSRSPQIDRRNPMMEEAGGKGGALFNKIRQRSESAENLRSGSAPVNQWGRAPPQHQQSMPWGQPGGMNQYNKPPAQQMMMPHSLATNKFGVSDL